MPTKPTKSEDHIVNMIVQHQHDLHRYILSWLPNPALASDVLQETNLVLWNKAADYDSSRPFLPWALTFAFYQVKAARRDSARDRHVFDDDLLETLASEPLPQTENEIEKALEHCLSKLRADQRELIMARYQPGASVADLASSLSQTPNAISLGLLRIRASLRTCIEKQLSATS